ncbi:hypothetical protein ACVTKC_004535, partial [Citrobacter freundii]
HDFVLFFNDLLFIRRPDTSNATKLSNCCTHDEILSRAGLNDVDHRAILVYTNTLKTMSLVAIVVDGFSLL